MVIDEPRLLGVAFAGGYLMAAYHSRREAQLHAHQLVLSHVSTTTVAPKGELAMRDTWT